VQRGLDAESGPHGGRHRGVEEFRSGGRDTPSAAPRSRVVQKNRSSFWFALDARIGCQTRSTNAAVVTIAVIAAQGGGSRPTRNPDAMWRGMPVLAVGAERARISARLS
jgi:hypothetical protein